MKLLRQYNVPKIGGVVDVLYTTLPLYGLINGISITIILYEAVNKYLLEWFPWIKLWMFLAAFCWIPIVVMVVFYKFITPSLYAFRSKQMFEHESSISATLKRIEEKVDKLLS